MPVRDLTSDDHVSYRRLSSGAFGGPPPDPEPRPFTPGEIPIGVDSSALPGGADGVIAAGARIRRDRITWGEGAKIACGGIGGLAVHPAHRGGGLFRELIMAILARCDAEGMPVSMLYPSNPSIYRRFGYQVVASLHSIIVPLLDLQQLPRVPGRRLVPVTEETMPRVHALYRELTAGDNAMLLREGPLFPEGLPSDGWSALLLEDDTGTDHGYVSWNRVPSSERGYGLQVHELLGRTREDRIALLGSLASWSTVLEQVCLRLRTDDPVLDVLPGAGSRPTPDPIPLLMMRVIDTAAALEARRAPAGLAGSFRLVVEDATVPAGICRAGGAWVVTAADGTISAEPTEDAGTADGGTVRLSIHAASLLLVGGRTIADARRLGLEVEADAEAGRLLDALLAGPRPSVLDAF
ncbi:GNAT family N-acetyltransferase [Brachybacterium sp. AOP3-A1-3]|uniref:GNAT family N-acetyltransferase n=1 Tax=Brachybacterium sp. AOP3-A1-3 TaxID=3457699 RepID=UPI0040336881